MPKHRYRRLQLPRLIVHRLRRSGGLFDECCVLLGNLIHLAHRRIDLFDTKGLLVGRHRDLGYEIGDALDGLLDGKYDAARAASACELTSVTGHTCACCRSFPKRLRCWFRTR